MNYPITPFIALYTTPAGIKRTKEEVRGQNQGGYIFIDKSVEE